MNIYGRLLKMMGWKAAETAAPEPKCIILGVPHTSIMDFVIAFLYYKSLGHTARVMIKKEFFKGPLGALLRKVGCIPVDRKNGAAVIRSAIDEMNAAEGDFHLCIAPEGTRKPVARWKMGYHKIAMETGVAVYLGYFDWGTKTVGRGHKFELTGDAKADTEAIQAKYEEMHLVGKHPEKYITH